MISTNTRLEAVEAIAPNVILTVAKTPVDALPDRTKDGLIQPSHREIQNLSGADLFFAVGADANANAGQFFYHGKLVDGDRKVFFTKQRVSVYSVAGGRVATFELVVRGQVL